MDPLDSVQEKVLAIFRDVVGDRSDRLSGSQLSEAARTAIRAAFEPELGPQKAGDLALHMADWNWDAAFVVALHLFPERFSAEEVEAGVGLFLTHAPHHIRAACGITETYVWENFPDDGP